MSKSGASFAGRYVRLMLVCLLLGVIAAGVGFLPTRRIAGASGIEAMVAGCGVAVLSGWVGGLVACHPGGESAARINRLLGATAVRMFAAVGLALAVVFTKAFPTKPLVLWVALAYMITLFGETALFVRWSRQDESPAGS